MKQVTMLTILLFAVALPARGQTNPALRYVEPSPETGASGAVVAAQEVPLAHTDQFMALDAKGQLVGAGDAEAQAEQVLDNIRRALAEVDAGISDLVKLDVYVTGNEEAEQVRRFLADRFTGQAKPAVSFVVTDLPEPEALVAMDAVATAPAREQYQERVTYSSGAVYGPAGQGRVAVMPPGERVYVSGQVAPGNLIEATRGTMQSLHATLAYLEMSADDVVQVKGFLPDISRADEVEREIDAYYKDKPSPPIVLVEWKDSSYLSYLSTEGKEATPIEIEVIAAPGQAREAPISGEALSYITPPNMTAPLTYTRVVVVHRGDLLYTSGFYGDPGKDGAGEIRDIFGSLQNVLQQAGSDFDHLAKGTYYVTSPASSKALNEIRQEYYDPKRAPASAKMPVRDVGKDGAEVTFDMIGVVPVGTSMDQ